MRVKCNLRELRGRRQLSEVAREAGVFPGDLSRIERGIMLPAGEVIPALEAAYGVSLTEMYDWQGPFLAVEMETAA